MAKVNQKWIQMQSKWKILLFWCIIWLFSGYYVKVITINCV